MWSAWNDTPLCPPTHVLTHTWLNSGKTDEENTLCFMAPTHCGDCWKDVVVWAGSGQAERIGHHFYQNVYYTVVNDETVTWKEQLKNLLVFSAGQTHCHLCHAEPVTVGTHDMLSRWKTGHSFQVVFKESRFVPNRHSFDKKGDHPLLTGGCTGWNTVSSNSTCLFSL